MNYSLLWTVSVVLLTAAIGVGMAKAKLESMSTNMKLMWEKFDDLVKSHRELREDFVEVRTKVTDLVLRVDAHNSANVVNAVQGFTEMMDENLDKVDDKLDELNRNLVAIRGR